MRTEMFQVVAWSEYGRKGQQHWTSWSVGRKLSAVYTVEASYVLAIVMLSVAVLIRSAYVQYQDKTSWFLMNNAVERLYGQEEKCRESFGYAAAWGKAERTGTFVSGTIQTSVFSRSIQKRLHEPEEVLWMTTIFQKKKGAGRSDGANEGQLSPGDEEELSDD